MARIDERALNANFELWREERMPDEDVGKAFELYVIEQVLKDYSVSDNDIDSGHVGGSGDGGIDGMYFLIDGSVVKEDDPPIDGRPQSVELVLVQVKRSRGFSGNMLERIDNFVRDILDWDTHVDEIAHWNTPIRNCVRMFRETYDRILHHAPKLRLSVYYVTGRATTPHTDVIERADRLTAHVKNNVSDAIVEIEMWNCGNLLDTVRRAPKETFKIRTVKMFATDDEAAVVCLVRVLDIASLLRDERGGQRLSLLEANVRAHQGNVNVNQDIRKTLADGSSERDFWWFNNGVTIVAESLGHVAGRRLIINSPKIVNGLQTCHEIFEYVERVKPADDKRSILLRVIVPPDADTRRHIIKATNFQTAISPISLWATEKLQYDIEDRLKSIGLYYDRRKGMHRAQRRRRADIVSMRDLGKSVISIALRQPDTARARPGKLLNTNEGYKKVFPDGSDADVYVTCILIDRRVVEFLKNESGLPPDVRADLRYYYRNVGVL